MTAHYLRGAFALDPLIAEAKRRMRRRRYLIGLALVAAVASIGTIYSVGSHPSGPRGGSSAKPSLRSFKSDGWSVPYAPGMHVETSCWCATYGWPIYETTFANFVPVKGEQERGQGNLYEPPPQGSRRAFPAHGVALRLVSQSPFLREHSTPLPLRLSSFHLAPKTWYPGIRPRPLLREFSVGQRYLAEVWIGPNVSARQRAELARMIASLKRTTVRSSARPS